MDKRFPIEDQIRMLASALRGRIAMPGEQHYDDWRGVALDNFDHRPAGIVRVANATDVAAAVNFAQATGLALAVRSGGHSTCGHSGNNGGLVVDLRDLNRIEIDQASRTAWIGTGLTAGEVTAALEPHGLIIGFGDSGSVGVGGLTLGGGIGFLVRKHGLTIDSLLAAEIVTAAGDIVIADASHHQDLFWAIRGGGGNFGVATRLKFRAEPLPEFIGGPLVLPPTPQVIAGFAAAAEAAPEELSTIATVMPLPPLPFVPKEAHGQKVFVALMAYAGSQAGAAAALAPFRALATPLADMVRPAPLSSLYIPEEGPKPTVTVRSRFIDRFGEAEAGHLLAAYDRSSAPMKMAQIRVLGGAFGRVAEDATAFAHRKSRIMVSFLALYGGGANAAPEHESWASEAISAFGDGTGAYVNFLGKEGTEGLGAAYPPATLARLRRVKRQYDPDNLFRLNQNILPA